MLSIIIPTYNSSAVLGRALNSIVGQTFTGWEVLIMDGASKDNTVEIAESYHDKRIKVFSEPDKGIYDAMNKGVKKAQGEWLYFLGSDDSLYDSYVLKKVFGEIGKNDEIVYGEVFAPHLTLEYKGEWSLDKVWYNRCHQAIFYKRTVFKEYGLYDQRYKVLADFAFNLRWFLQGKIKNRYVGIIVANYSEGGLSQTTRDEVFNREFGILLLKYGRKVLPISIQKEAIWDAIRNNPDRVVLRLVLKSYLYYLRIMDKKNRLLCHE